MYQLFETILVEKGEAELLPYHNVRFNRTRCALFDLDEYINLEGVIQKALPDDENSFRCRITYGRNILNVEFSPYIEKEIRSLKLVHADDIEYHYKYKDRKALDELKNSVKSDDIIIIKDGMVTDSSIANLVFRTNGHFITPSTPLLRGTRRQDLLDKGKIVEALISEEDLIKMEEVFLVNALRPLDTSKGLSIEEIIQ